MITRAEPSHVPRPTDPRLLADPPRLNPQVIRSYLKAVHPLERLFRPTFSHADNLPIERPLLFVGNHQLLSLDVPFLVGELFRRNIHVRMLADDFLFTFPPLSRVLEMIGALPGSPALAAALLQRGESLLVYPGGAREAAKFTGRPYSLDWWGRLGFARLALTQRCTIVPVAAAGVDESLHIFVAPERYLDSRLGTLADRLHLRRDLFLPLMVPTRVPRPRYAFCPPIHPPSSYVDAEASARRLRAETAAALQAGLAQLDAQPSVVRL